MRWPDIIICAIYAIALVVWGYNAYKVYRPSKDIVDPYEEEFK